MAVVAMIAAAALLFMSTPGILLSLELVIGPDSRDRHPRRLSPGSASPSIYVVKLLQQVVSSVYEYRLVASPSKSRVLGRPRSENNIEGPC